ncbi:hypothetical protein N7466_000246 [Penicillium verhagenii]|uniref:uncharacterized protein n=1 Tax=Penicillium verhagenii TaxID=1562060 RepID=UPI002545532F|nr:uncharacterized protein N7466_000246 [Penicillium verhagenii]KAJ5947231.1 hypothetical protein N7466_000246 [Penicillium verhagenii]
MPGFPKNSFDPISDLEAIIHYSPRDPDLPMQSLEAAGSTTRREGNKRLAIIGDAIIRLILYVRGYESNASTMEMTNAQNTKACNAYLAQRGFSLGIDSCIRLNPSAQGVIPSRLMATTMEAIVGAVYLDSGKDLAITGDVVVLLLDLD